MVLDLNPTASIDARRTRQPEIEGMGREDVGRTRVGIGRKKVEGRPIGWFGGTARRAAWIRLAEEEVESVQMRLDKLQHLAENAEPDSHQPNIGQSRLFTPFCAV